MRHFNSDPLFNRFARLLTADGDAAPGGGSSPSAVTPPAGDAGAAAAPAVEAPKIAPASEPTSLLSEAKAPDAPAPVAETEEQKAARLAAETPEQKTAREAEEAKVRTEAMVPYDALKLPEGMPADQPAFVDFKNAAHDLGVEPEKAQKLIDTVAPKMKEALEGPYNLWADTQVKWVNEIKADAELGGAKFDANIANAAIALDKFGTPEEGRKLRAALAFTGAGNNPEIFRWMARVGAKFKEGGPVQAQTAPAKAFNAADLYPTMKPS